MQHPLGGLTVGVLVGSAVAWVWIRWRTRSNLQRLTSLLRSREAGNDLSEWTQSPGRGWDELEAEIQRLKRDAKKSAETAAREARDVDSMMAAISDAVVAVNRKAQVLFFNSQFALWFGRGADATEKLVGLSDWIRDPAALDAFSKGASDGVELSFVSESDGIARDVSLTVRPLSRESVLGVFHDVSSLKHAERMRIDFVANVSHEIKTPLTAIKGFTETMVQDLAGVAKGQGPADATLLAGVHDAAQRVQRNADRLMALVQDLLDLSALEQPGELGQLQKTWISTRELTQQVLSRLSTKTGGRSEDVSIEVSAEEVLGDPMRVEQVLTNLLDNAMKYTPEGSEIGIRWTPFGTPFAQGVHLVVWDRGPGISIEHQRRLFERFYRVDRARSRSLGGTGLGLAIVKHIVQKHGGQVRVDSELGEGSAFTCEFPHDRDR